MKDIIRTILNEWKERKLPKTIGRETNLESYTKLQPPKITVITGFRRTGKTYMVFRLIKELVKDRTEEQVPYINFEDERIPLKTEFLTELLPVMKQTYKKQAEFLFLDEVHNIPEWSRWLRRIYDTEKLRIFVTGSSSKMSGLEIPTELRGRFLEVKVFPLSFKEFINFKRLDADFEKVDYSENEKAKIIRAFNEYLEFGGMPEVVLASEDKKIEIIHNYYDTLIRRDIIERFRVRNEEGLKALLKLLTNSTSYSISKSYNTLKSLNFEIGKGTVQSYLAYIENSYFLYSVPLLSFKIKDSLQYPRKVYLIDNGFITALSLKFSKNLGRLYENLVFIELKRRLPADLNQEIFYWKNQQKEEVDFAIKNGLKIKQLIQVCYDIEDYDTKKRELRALLKASKELKCHNLLIITEDKEGEEKIRGRRVRYRPLWKWLLEKSGKTQL